MRRLLATLLLALGIVFGWGITSPTSTSGSGGPTRS